ncbi:hypothetical protein EW146_g4925 [Bondarzewia mesenterica]|uniref:Uncharacterized protein n=1 Tax=Bondarzewia mesenterica TaxID=1095465 RepID=A0A4S4LUU9_9AGAM|nr:hypothetical protein EW146_g4925 [Bondarzewia mesenterica]
MAVHVHAQVRKRRGNSEAPSGAGARSQTAPDDDAWEDISDSRSPNASQQSSGTVTPRKRRPGVPKQRIIAINAAASPRKHAKTPTVGLVSTPSPFAPPQPPPPYARNIKARESTLSKEELQDALSSGAFNISAYIIDVISSAVRLLKKPFSFLLFLYILALILARISTTLRATLSPLCFVPGLSWLCPAPIARTDPNAPPRWADYPQLVKMQSETLETLLDEAVDGPGLALEIKKAEMATSDLASLVRVSDLTSRDRLAEVLAEFVLDARKAGRGLQRFNAKVDGAVDSVLTINDHALRAIEAANSKSSAVVLHRLWPFSSTSEAATRAVVTRTFGDAMNVLSTSMRRLVLEAEISLADLNKLEERLWTLAELVAREDSTLSSTRADLLADLWTRLGGNRKVVRGVEGHMMLLRNVGTYRKRALAHVVATLHTLEGMSEDMEELRERVTAPDLVGDKIPIEVHMKSIRTGLERLQERRIRARESQDAIVNRVMGVVSDAKTPILIG